MSREFNFDELDKAVNSLIGDSPKQPAASAAVPAASQPAQPVPSQAPVQQTPSSASPVPPRASNTPVPSRNIPALERQVPAAPSTPPISSTPQVPPAAAAMPPTPAQPVAEKPGVPGRFMDVMHPASDMATPAKEEVKKGMGAEGKTIEPLNNNITPEPLPEKSAANTPNSAQLTMQTPVNPDAMVATPDTEEKAWKDPLEEATKNEKERAIKQGAQERLGLTPKPSEKEAKPEDGKKPLFLPDAKVEKRPLGAFAEDNKAEDKDSKDDAKDTKESPAKLTIDGVGDVDGEEKKAEDESSDLLLPELGKEIVAVEAGDAIAGDEDLEKKEKDKEKSKDQDKQKEEKDKKTPAKPETFSIPKQYKEKQASTDHKPKSIYDTEEYHRSLATAAAKKKKNSKWWVWALVILGLLILGVGLGAGAYFLVGI